MHLIAKAVGHQVQFPAIGVPVARAIGVGFARVVGAAKLFHHAAGQPDAPAGSVAEGDLLHFGMALGCGMPEVDARG